MTDQNSQFFAILTAVGKAKQANADALGVPWTFTQLGVGDANGTEPIPSEQQTRLINERRRAPLNQLRVDPNNSSIIIAEQVIPESVGGWWIREVGLYDAAGDLVAVANCAPSFKPLLSQGSGRTQIVRMNLIVSNTGNVELKIDPSVVLATRAYVDAKVLEEIYKLDSKQSVRGATTANIVLAGLQSVDGIALVEGDRVLVKNQTKPKENGLYVAAAGAWPRTADADASPEVTSAMIVSVEQGATLADTRWQLVTDGVIVLGTTDLTFQDVTKGFAPLSSPVFIDSPTAPTPPQFDASKRLVTMEALKRFGLQASGRYAFSANKALTSVHAGATVIAFGTTPVVFTLPAAADFQVGARIEFFSELPESITTINRVGTDTIVTNGSNLALTTISLLHGDTLTLECNGGGWDAVSGSAQLGYAGTFASRLAANGYQRHPSGKVEQWGGSGSIPAGSQVTITLPIAMPAALHRVVATVEDSTSNSTPVAAAWSPVSTSQFILRNKSTVAAVFSWLAIGS